MIFDVLTIVLTAEIKLMMSATPPTTQSPPVVSVPGFSALLSLRPDAEAIAGWARIAGSIDRYNRQVILHHADVTYGLPGGRMRIAALVGGGTIAAGIAPIAGLFDSGAIVCVGPP
jgi:hypothetical protein